jgi:alpha-D-ribose 1-methylphosphonate 5-triphosphate diphosphatase
MMKGALGLKQIITGGRVLWEDGTVTRDAIAFENGIIVEDASGADREWNAGGCLVLPGIVDLHGDAFEHLAMPRPRSFMPYDVALAEADRQIVANGITTAFFGLSYTWEPGGLRSGDAARSLLDAFERARPALGCDARLHLRFEISHVDAVDEVAGWIEAGRADLVAFNDHISHQEAEIQKPGGLALYAQKAGGSEPAWLEMFERAKGSMEAARRGVKKLAAEAARAGVAMASHDEETPAIRDWYHGLGCRICEFPVNRETARAAVEMGDPVVLGAPNAFKGGSLYARLPARECIREGLCSVLTSDYYYPSLLHAAFLLVQEGICDLPRAWDLISKNPAQAARLNGISPAIPAHGAVDSDPALSAVDSSRGTEPGLNRHNAGNSAPDNPARGTLAPGCRADFVLVDDSNPLRPQVKATFGAGRLVCAADPTVCGGKP